MRITEAINQLKETGEHGLIVQEEIMLNDDLILKCALRYAEAHNGKLPTQRSKDIEGMPGQKWMNLNRAIVKRSRGLTREGVKGLAHLFRLYGLVIGRSENPETIREAITNLRETGEHKLVIQEEVLLSEDLILMHALRYAEKNEGRR